MYLVCQKYVSEQLLLVIFPSKTSDPKEQQHGDINYKVHTYHGTVSFRKLIALERQSKVELSFLKVK